MDAPVGNAAGKRRVALQRAEFSSDPRALRQNLDRLDALVHESNASARRRVGLMFGQLVAQWQSRFVGESMAVSVELLEGAVRLSTGGARRTLRDADWQALVTPSILDLVDAWGIDRRHQGDAWFEFREARARRPPAEPPAARRVDH